MRKTSSAVKTLSTRAFSSRADFRSCPNGFSTTTRRQPPDCSFDAIPVRSICLSTVGKRRRRDREVERGVAADAVAVLEVDQLLAQPVESVVVVEGSGDELDAVGEPVPDLLAELGAGMRLRGLARQLGEIAVAPSRAGRSRAATKPGGSSPRLARS